MKLEYHSGEEKILTTSAESISFQSLRGEYILWGISFYNINIDIFKKQF